MANAEGLSVIKTAISALSVFFLIASIIDWKFDPLPEARTPILSVEISSSGL